MRILLFLFFLLTSNVSSFSQNELKFGLQTGATVSTFQTSISITNAFALTVPPINEFDRQANFHISFWFEKRLNNLLALRLEVERSPGGAKAVDAQDNRLKRYKFFQLGVPILLKWTPFQSKARFPIQLETGVSANFFLFDYGEPITFGNINQLEYRAIVGLSTSIDKHWSVSLRYLKGINSYSTYDAGGIKIDWTNQMYVLAFGRSLFSLTKKDQKKSSLNKKRKKKKSKKRKRKKKR